MRVQGCFCYDLRATGLFLSWISVIFLVLGFLNTLGEIVLDKTSSEVQQDNIYTLVATVIDLLICGILIVGISKNKPLLMLPWLILRGIVLVLLLVLGLISLFIAGYTFDSSFFLILFLFAIIYALLAWIWMVMYSLYHEICDNK